MRTSCFELFEVCCTLDAQMCLKLAVCSKCCSSLTGQSVCMHYNSISVHGSVPNGHHTSSSTLMRTHNWTVMQAHARGLAAMPTQHARTLTVSLESQARLRERALYWIIKTCESTLLDHQNACERTCNTCAGLVCGFRARASPSSRPSLE